MNFFEKRYVVNLLKERDKARARLEEVLAVTIRIPKLIEMVKGRDAHYAECERVLAIAEKRGVQLALAVKGLEGIAEGLGYDKGLEPHEVLQARGALAEIKALEDKANGK